MAAAGPRNMFEPKPVLVRKNSFFKVKNGLNKTARKENFNKKYNSTRKNNGRPRSPNTVKPVLRTPRR